jgi:signal transduction histidine kinase
MTTTIDQPSAPTETSKSLSRADYAKRVEDLGRIILAYSEVTERLEQSHEALNRRVAELQRELSDKKRQLERRSRLAALGEMAAGIAHEIRNPLGAIRLYASLMRRDLAGTPTGDTAVKIESAVARMESIVSQVLGFTREIVADRVVCDLVELTRETIEMVRASHANASARVVASTPDRLEASVDARLVSQALANLVRNGLDAVGPEGVVALTLTHRGAEVTLRVEDSGPGLAADVADRIFHPFFTTKDDGTGLGLAITHRIVEAHDGTIEAGRSEQLRGARFDIILPMQDPRR